MLTNFQKVLLARLSQGPFKSWPHWKVLANLGLGCALLAYLLTLKAIGDVGDFVWWLIDFTAISFILIISVVFVNASHGKFNGWYRNNKELPVKPGSLSVSLLNFVMLFFFVVMAFGYGIDRTGVLRVWLFHPDPAEVPLNPILCVNDPTSGLVRNYTGPLSERLILKTSEMQTVGVCPHPLNEYTLKVEGIWVAGEYYPGQTEVTFNPPKHLYPGQQMWVVFQGKETDHYKQTNSPSYLIERSLQSVAEITEAVVVYSQKELGFGVFDWEKARLGLTYQDYGTRPDGRLDVIYVTYADQSLVGPASNSTTIPLRFCKSLIGDLVERLHGTGFENVYLYVPPEGGRLLINSWENNETLLTCSVRP